MTKIDCICASYNRPALLGNAIAMFLKQDIKDSHLWILEDSGIFGDKVIDGGRWTIVSTTKRYPCVGSKRNALMRMCESDYVCNVDDDDHLFGWHLSAAYNALHYAPYSLPSQAMEFKVVDGKVGLIRCYTLGEPVRARLVDGKPQTFQDCSDTCYGAQFAWRKSAMLSVGGYPEGYGNGEDTALVAKMFRKFGPPSDPLRNPDYSKPSYIYTRDMSGDIHGSECRGERMAYMAEFAKQPRRNPDDFVVKLPDLYDWALANIPETTQPRAW